MTTQKWFDLIKYALKILFVSMATLGTESTAIYLTARLIGGNISILPMPCPYNFEYYYIHIITTIILVAWLKHLHPEKLSFEL